MGQLNFPLKRRRKAPVPKEHDEQAALFQWWWRTPWAARILLFAIPNGGARDIITGARLKAEGVLAGVPDLFLACPAGESNGLFIEMKRQRGGKVSDKQFAVIQRLQNAGYSVVIAHGMQEAMDAIKMHLADAEAEKTR